MKKSLIVMLLVFALCVGGLVCAHAAVDGTKEEVVLTETVLAGDQSAAEGLLVETEAYSGNRELVWETSLLYRDNASYDTTFAFYPNGKDYEYSHDPQWVRVENMSMQEVDYSMSQYDQIEDPYDKMLLSPLMDVLSRAPNGQEYSENVSLKDYYEYYPVAAGGELFYLKEYTEEEEAEWNEAFREYFRIPVEPDDIQNIHVETDSEGKLWSWGGGSEEVVVQLNGVSTASDTAAYFSIDNRVYGVESEETRYVDTSLIPGGYGIYSIPYKDNKPVVDELFTFYPLEETTYVRDMQMSKDNRHILVQTVEPDYYLLVIDAETGETVQKLFLGSGDTYGYLRHFEGFSVWYQDEQNLIQVLELREDGTYEPVLTADVSPIRERGWDCYDGAAWDGERLALVDHQMVEVLDDRGYNYNAFLCGFYVAVYTADGLRFLGQYDSTLDMEPPNPWWSITTPEQELSPKVTWVE